MAARFRGSGPVAILKSWWAAYLAWRIQRAAMIQLASMSDRELQDIGLTRNQIRRRDGRPQRPPVQPVLLIGVAPGSPLDQIPRAFPRWPPRSSQHRLGT